MKHVIQQRYREDSINDTIELLLFDDETYTLEWVIPNWLGEKKAL